MEPTRMSIDYVAAVLKGDSTLIRQIYHQFFPLISNMIQENGGTGEDAKDVFQDAVMVIYEKAKHPGFHLTSQFSTFLYGICRNLWLSRRQKKSSKEVTIPDDAKYLSGELPDLDFAEVERRNLFDKAFAQLGEDCQKLLLLFFEKVQMDDIARLMGYSSGYARRRKFMCKEHLTELVKSYPEYHELCNTYQNKEAHGKD